VQNGIGLVYGGAQVGLMGKLADSVIEKGGEVIGVIPESLVEKEIAHTGLSDLHVVKSMHERKAMMADLADGFLALPGGMGTLEELFEILTWAQLGLHDKPCRLLNIRGYYTPLLTFVDHMVEQEFLKTEHRAMILTDQDPKKLIQAMQQYEPPKVVKWISERET
jgi:uncharacterized protein (TIGR00730 family)